MGACKHDGIAIGKDKGSLEQASLLHALDGMRQLDVMHIDELMLREQPDAILASTELDGGPEQALHAAIEGYFGDEIAVILVRTIGAVGILVNFLQSDKIGLILLD